MKLTFYLIAKYSFLGTLIFLHAATSRAEENLILFKTLQAQNENYLVS